MDRIQVAVTIAMPSPSLSSSHTYEKPRGSDTGEESDVMNNAHANNDDWTRPVAYTLGLYERPWKQEEG